MRRICKKELLIISIITLFIITSGCGKEEVPEIVSPDQKSEIETVIDTEDNYVATIDEERITQSEFKFFLGQTKGQMESYAMQTGVTDMNEYWNTEIDGKSPKEIAKEETLNNIQVYKIELIKAIDNNITFDDSEKVELEQKWDEIISNNGGIDVITETIKQRFGITLEQYRQVFDDSMMIDKYMNVKKDEIEVSQDEIDKYYEDDLETVTVSHVLFSTIDNSTKEPLSDDKIQIAQKNSEDVLARVNAGEDINELAKELSEDPGATENSGDYSFKKDGRMAAEFQQWAFDNEIGDTGIVKTQFGYHVMKKIAESSKEEAIDDIKVSEISNIIQEWRNDPKYEIQKNESIYNSIEVN